MALKVRVRTNSDDALIAWRAPAMPTSWEGFAITKRDVKTGLETAINNRIPPKPGQGAVPSEGIASSQSPIRRLMWVDHSLNEGDVVQYKVTAMRKHGAGFVPVASSASPWSDPVTASADGDENTRAVFNRGTLMSQVVTRLVHGDVSLPRLRTFVKDLAKSGGPGRRYLSGQARSEMLGFLAAADRRGSEIYAALYECNDQELIDGLKAFGPRGHVLLGNGGTMRAGLAAELAGAQLDVHRRDLSGQGLSSPSVHNKFVVETNNGTDVRVLTGSTNWTTTGLCTQLNNVIILNSSKLAGRFHKQWDALVAAGDAMPAQLVKNNAVVLVDGRVEVSFVAVKSQVELARMVTLIDGAKEAILFLMFMPGQSPVLEAVLDRAKVQGGPLVRGVVSTVQETKTGKIKKHGAHVISQGPGVTIEETAKLVEVVTPAGVRNASATPVWAKEEFDRANFLSAGMNAIVHSKAIVIDPFGADPVVITGSHNFSGAASQKNDENLLIIRGDRKLAERYAVHMQSVYDHYAWRAYLNEGGDDHLYDGLSAWSQGEKARTLDMWMK